MIGSTSLDVSFSNLSSTAAFSSYIIVEISNAIEIAKRVTRSCSFRVVSNLSRFKHDSFTNPVKMVRPNPKTENK